MNAITTEKKYSEINQWIVAQILLDHSKEMWRREDGYSYLNLADLAGWVAVCFCSTATAQRWPPSWRPGWIAASYCPPVTWNPSPRHQGFSPDCTWPPRCWKSAPHSVPPRSAHSSHPGWAPPQNCWASWSRWTGGPESWSRASLTKEKSISREKEDPF